MFEYHSQESLWISQLSFGKFEGTITSDLFNFLISLIFLKHLSFFKNFHALIFPDDRFCIVVHSAVVKNSNEMLLFLKHLHRHRATHVYMWQFRGFDSIVGEVLVRGLRFLSKKAREPKFMWGFAIRIDSSYMSLSKNDMFCVLLTRMSSPAVPEIHIKV